MENFIHKWGEAAYTTVGFFWMALWAFILGYALSSAIQVFVTKERMQRTMGAEDIKSIFLGTFFGFISSSCSFSALATTKSLFQKGASFIASIAFLLASTNLVIELGIIISLFLGWQFVVGEYVGGVLLILTSWLLVKIIRPKNLIDKARERLGSSSSDSTSDQTTLQKLQSRKSWAKVGHQYGMEWNMVWKDVTFGFTIAGVISAFVPDAFFSTLFIGSGSGQESFSFLELLEHVLVGPLAAFMTFIGSMGNIPLAGLLFGKGVSYAGVIAFIFSDLVVFPVLRINAKYYGWKMSLFILFLLFASLIITSLVLHYGFDFLGMIPSSSQLDIVDKEHFAIDYTFFMNLAFLAISGVLVYLGFFSSEEAHHHHEMAPKSPLLERILKWLAIGSYVWLIVGLILKFMY